MAIECLVWASKVGLADVNERVVFMCVADRSPGFGVEFQFGLDYDVLDFCLLTKTEIEEAITGLWGQGFLLRPGFIHGDNRTILLSSEMMDERTKREQGRTDGLFE